MVNVDMKTKGDQEQSLLPNLTVGENVYLGNEAKFTRGGLVRWGALYAAARRQLEKVGLGIDPRARAADLDFATRQMVELAKALTLEEHAQGHLVILLDEPTSVLERRDIEILFERVRALKSRASFGIRAMPRAVPVWTKNRLTQVGPGTDANHRSHIVKCLAS